MGSIEGPAVLITGAGRGIGAATASLLAANGARLFLVSRSETELASQKQQLETFPGQVEYAAADVSVAADVQRVVDAAVASFGRLDVIIANAGVAINAPLESGDLADWNTMIDVNLRGLLHAIAAGLPAFHSQGRGHFVIIGSTSATKWVPGQAVYAATKSAVRAVSDILRQEQGPSGVRVTYIAPGFTDTSFVSSTKDAEERKTLEARRDEIAMPPSAIAEAVLYALSQPDSVNVGEITVRPTVQP